MKKIDLAEVRAKNLPRLDWHRILTVNLRPESKDDPTAAGAMREQELLFENYFRTFADTLTVVDGAIERIDCPGCGAALSLGDGIRSMLLGATFVWGIAHGEGYCRECGYPARAIHYDVGLVERLNFILPVHPDELREKEEKDDATRKMVAENPEP